MSDLTLNSGSRPFKRKLTYAEIMARQRERAAGTSFDPNASNDTEKLALISQASTRIKSEFDDDEDVTPRAMTTYSLKDLRPAKRVKTSEMTERPKPKALGSRRNRIQFRGEDYETAGQWSRNLSSQDGPLNRNLRDDLARIVSNIRAYQDQPQDQRQDQRQDQKLKSIRTLLSRVAVSQQMNGTTLVDSDFLPRILQTGIISERAKEIFPPDIIDDCADLWQRLNSGNLDGHPLRGMLRNKLTNSKKDTIKHANGLDPSYEFKKPADRVGANGQHVGACWMYTICCLRDGCHGAPQAGIYGNERSGAISILLAESYEDDYDNGEEFWYSSTKQMNADKASEATSGTKNLEKAYAMHTPIRVVRAGNNANKKLRSNPYRPLHGYRYDGLYRIEESQLVDAATHLYRYRFVRLPNQSPIRYQAETARPNADELRAWKNARAEVKMAE